ncbi:MAG: GNAT family N-acetyltransferase [Armatimonadetes bacterium]|nr:GNAT family N-acetyltransferase [Armatimonadota bacterium]
MSQPKPQLAMRRASLEDLPEVALPPGYRIRSFRPGDEAHWATIISESFGGPAGPQRFDMMKDDAAFRPERVLFVECEEGPVGTASAWSRVKQGKDAGYLHMVGVRPAHAGKRLGYWVSLAALRQLAREGKRSALLHTDDFRLAAIKTYLRLGFEPLLVSEEQPGRWRAVFEQLGEPRFGEEFRAILEGPVRPPA